MENWILKGAKTLVNEPRSINVTSPTQVKVKVSHLMLTDLDALLYNGLIDAEYPKVPGRAAVGIVTEAGENCYGVEKGTRVYFNPSRECGECLPCKTGKPKNCARILSAGRDFDGFMRDFVVCDYTDVAPLPDSVSDFHALCIETIGIAENIYDKLNLSAGQRVAVVGGSFSGNIIAQVLQYHKIVPILIDNNPTNLATAKNAEYITLMRLTTNSPRTLKTQRAETYATRRFTAPLRIFRCRLPQEWLLTAKRL